MKALSIWPAIIKLDLTGNPVCEKKKYRDRVFVMSKTLGTACDNYSNWN
jgi:hypothetical protein